MKRTSKKGFTLMEMLIVIAIIAILIAIAIPVFTAQLDKAKLNTDRSNARSLKSMVTTTYLSTPEDGLVKAGASNAKVYYMNKTATEIQVSASNALECEGSGTGYSSDHSADAKYIWVYWDGSSVTDTNPSLE